MVTAEHSAEGGGPPEEPRRRPRPALRARLGLATLYLGLRGMALASLTPNHDVRLYWEAAEAFFSGQLLWVEHAFEYPPGALLFVLPPAWLAGTLEAFPAAYALWTLLFDALIVVGVYQLALRSGPSAGRARRAAIAAGLYITLTALLGDLPFQRLDLGVAAVVVAIGLLLQRGGPRGLVEGLIALGFALKLVVVLLLPVVVLYRVYGSERAEEPAVRRRRLAREAAGTSLRVGAYAVAIATPFLVTSGAGLMSVLTFHAERGLQIESTWSSALLLARHLFPFELAVGFNFGATHLGGPAASALAAVSTPLSIVAVGLVLARWSRCRVSSVGDWMAAASSILLVFVLTAKVLSPQFLIWVAPTLAAWWALDRRVGVLVALFGAFALTGFLIQFGYQRLTLADRGAAILLGARNACLLVIAAVVLVRPRGPALAVPASLARALPLVGSVAGLAALVATALRDVTSFDFWLHRFVGRQILQTERVPTVDHYTAAGEGNPFVAHEWLSAIFLYLVDEGGGAPALIALRVFAVLAVVVLLHLTAPAKARRTWWWPVLILLAVIAWRARLQVRPHLLALVVLCAFAWALARYRRDPRLGKLWPLVPLQILWANLHASCFLGPALVASWALCWAWLDRGERRATSSGPGRLALVAGAGFALCALNPRGWTLFSFALSLFFDDAPRRYLQEWRAPLASFDGASYQVAFLLVLGLYAFVLASGWRRAQVDRSSLSWSVAVGVAAAGLGLTAARFQAPMTALLLPELARLLLLHRRELPELMAPPPASLGIGGGLVVVSLAGFLHAGALTFSYGERMPWEPVAELKRRGLEGVIYNEYEDGGFLLDALWPRMRPVVDGRIDVLGWAAVERYRASRFDVGALERLLAQHDVTAVLLARARRLNDPAHDHLRRSRVWERVLVTGDRVLYLRRRGPPSLAPR